MPRAGLDENFVLQAAAELADTLGADGVTLAVLAKRLNIRPPSLYNHIQGLPDLRRKLAVYGVDLLYREMKQALESGVSKPEKLQALVEAYLSFAERHPGLYELTQRSLGPEVRSAGEPIVQLMLEQLKQMGIYGRSAIHAVRGLRSILHGFVSLSKEEGFGLPYAWKESLDYTLRAFLKGLKTMAEGNK
ncbi:TetR/AcrR family transcriptional regulator [Paenibacillus pinistramenti]|uniref:TetR/AcrR family transcriptional regulator n=1 Tax=Paenibacillus pinistramenti TaxID=1768003 RepID=UPI0011096F7C|nr:TetR/AcrR family transcriptional regulator [Paenibacillus pinistramenti]